jgi:hypothetical protein
MEDPDRFFARQGPLEAVLAAKQAGKVRYVGFTGHKDPVVHLRMLEVAAAHNFSFDSCQIRVPDMRIDFDRESDPSSEDSRSSIGNRLDPNLTARSDRLP